MPSAELRNLRVQLDPTLDKALEETADREERTKRAVVERALREYVARSKANAAAVRSLTQSGQLTS